MQWRTRRCAHPETASSQSLVAPRRSSFVSTLLCDSVNRRCVCGAVLQLQLQLRAPGVLQQKCAATPKFVSAMPWRREWTWSASGDESRESKEYVPRAVAPASRPWRRTDGTRLHASRKWSLLSLHTATGPTLVIKSSKFFYTLELAHTQPGGTRDAGTRTHGTPTVEHGQ